MAYCTTAELVSRFESSAEATHVSDATGTPNLTIFAEAADWGSGTIDMYLAPKYETPIDVSGGGQLSTLLKGWNLTLGEWWLRPRTDVVPAALENQYQECMKALRDIGKGLAELPIGSTDEVTIDAVVVYESDETIFDRSDVSSL